MMEDKTRPGDWSGCEREGEGCGKKIEKEIEKWRRWRRRRRRRRRRRGREKQGGEKRKRIITPPRELEVETVGARAFIGLGEEGELFLVRNEVPMMHCIHLLYEIPRCTVRWRWKSRWRWRRGARVKVGSEEIAVGRRLGTPIQFGTQCRYENHKRE